MTLLIRFSLGFLLVFVAFFLIALVLIQRGRGGGLAGAFGGAGGQSAFGTKAGDVFTRITVGVAAAWIILCILAINVLGTSRSRLSASLGNAAGLAVPSEVAPGETPASADEPEGGAAAEPASGETDAEPARAE
jgi:preprotein translocase subunit SecG